jgi:D-arabinose 1-dehydrogenase-like Zn-dependent alcohol dehydrogenase
MVLRRPGGRHSGRLGMKAVRLTQIGAPLELQEIPTPSLGLEEVLVRIRAAGICHSDAHYRKGTSSVGSLPQTLGHEIAGVVEAVGPAVREVQVGDRVAVHYLVTCGRCLYCSRGQEQFCVGGQMVGKHRDGGYAECIAVPARSLVALPEEIPFEHGAVMMCSSATSLHALRKARLQAGETVAVFGVGGLGMSAVQLARGMGALVVLAVDIDPRKLALAEAFGAVPVLAGARGAADPVEAVLHLTGGRGVDVALELVGRPEVMSQAVRSLAVLGRAVMVGIADRPLAIRSYPELLCKEAEVIGCSDHLLQEFPLLFEYARRGVLDLSRVVARRVPLEAGTINDTLDALERFGGDVRTVIVT